MPQWKKRDANITGPNCQRESVAGHTSRTLRAQHKKFREPSEHGSIQDRSDYSEIASAKNGNMPRRNGLSGKYGHARWTALRLNTAEA
jgi:hypothetical protein